ncbi:MAG: hypothetical protein ACXW4A_00175 [Nitrospira sp.]
MVKTTVELPIDLWQAVKVRAAEERSDLRGVILKALAQYLTKRSTPREGLGHARRWTGVQEG